MSTGLLWIDKSEGQSLVEISEHDVIKNKTQMALITRTMRMPSQLDSVQTRRRRQLAILQLEDARCQVTPFAEAGGYITDEDIFDVVS